MREGKSLLSFEAAKKNLIPIKEWVWRGVCSKLRQPFVSGKRKLLVHACYHKVGTYWFAGILRDISCYYGLRFQNCEQANLRSGIDVWLEDHSVIDTAKLPDFAGSHIVRDPRDIVVSGYFYHLWTHEEWAHEKKDRYGGLSYQQYLNSIDPAAGIHAEIERSAANFDSMAAWNYEDPRFIEIKYEELIADEPRVFADVFHFFGFTDDAIRTCLQIAERHSFKSKARRAVGQRSERSHLRSGKPGEWKEFFDASHRSHFKERCGDVLIRLGYENSNDW